MEILKDEGFVDFVFKNVNFSKNGDIFLLEYLNNEIGFKIEIQDLLKKIPLSEDDNENFLYYGKGKILNIGEKYKNFIKILAENYEIEVPEILEGYIDFFLVGLASNPSKILEEDIRMKLFFNENNKFYSEIYLNTNFQEKTIYLNEKDEEYRKGIIYSFSGK